MNQPLKLAGIALAAGLGMFAMSTPAMALNITANTGIGSIATAQNINGYASTEFQTNIFNSTTIPHTSIYGTMNDSGTNYFEFSVGSAGSTGTFDVDCGRSCGVSFDPILALFDSSQHLLSQNDDSSVDPGSNHPYDSRIDNFVFAAAGNYILGITRFANFAPSIGGFPSIAGFYGDYDLHVSLSDPGNMAPVPEPSSILLMGTGLAGLLAWRKRKLAEIG